MLDAEDGGRDHIVIFVVTAGEGVRERAEAAKVAGEYFRSHALQALALESAEGAAEWLHRRIREDWGFPDPPSMTMPNRFATRYRGKRYSFGYPACPNLEDQAGIWKLLRAGGHRRPADRRPYDGPRSERQRAGVPPPGLRVLQRRGDLRRPAGWYHIHMKRTNLVLDAQVLEEATRVLGARTYSAAVNMALRETLRVKKLQTLHQFFGNGLWEGDLQAMREDRPAVGGGRSRRKSVR